MDVRSQANTGNLEQDSDIASVKPHSCCAPTADRETELTVIVQLSAEAERNPSPDALRPMVSLPDGTFLMGTDYVRGFPTDGEGPVRPVFLSPFDIDAFPVTNADFAQFISATGYRTEAELYGWSFVFWSHIPKSRFESLVEDTVAQAPWWCKVLDASWNQPEGPGSDVKDRLDHPVVHVFVE